MLLFLGDFADAKLAYLEAIEEGPVNNVSDECERNLLIMQSVSSRILTKSLCWIYYTKIDNQK
jgi:hypothetical protein